MKRNKINFLKLFIVSFSLLILFIPNKSVVSKDSGVTEIADNKFSATYNLDILPGLIKKDDIVKAGLLYDANQNKIVWEKGMDSIRPIASLTKMMTALLVAEDIKAEKINWDTSVPVTKEATIIKSSKVFLKMGETFTVHDLMKSSMISSANDACFLLAQFLGGTEAEFVNRMNERATQLGMQNTYFANSTGLPVKFGSKDNYSSPIDLLILINELLKYNEVVAMSSKNGEYIREGAEKLELRNHNKLAVEYNEVDGLKTGFTQKAGFCIAATANRCDNRLIAIVLGVQSQNARNKFVATMFNNYYNYVLCLGKLGEQIQRDTVNEKTIDSKQ